jgi:hypothetical protein
MLSAAAHVRTCAVCVPGGSHGGELGVCRAAYHLEHERPVGIVEKERAEVARVRYPLRAAQIQVDRIAARLY